ncbi:MAG TPA: aa3-type cytochrome c oxidase subunit IV [Sphingomonas sp.]|nr:aa3-type cytochrome c oxidase subunit IV [Sphingomonas sp.]
MAESGDMKAHEATYHSIMALLRWGAAACFIIGLFVVWIIS